MSNGSLITSSESGTGENARVRACVCVCVCVFVRHVWCEQWAVILCKSDYSIPTLFHFSGCAAGIPAEATATSVAAMAKAAVSHFGATTCPVTEELSKTRLDRSETACHNVSFGLIFTITFRLWIWVWDVSRKHLRFTAGPFQSQGSENKGLLWTSPSLGSICQRGIWSSLSWEWQTPSAICASMIVWTSWWVICPTRRWNKPC